MSDLLRGNGIKQYQHSVKIEADDVINLEKGMRALISCLEKWVHKYEGSELDKIFSDKRWNNTDADYYCTVTAEKLFD